MVVLVIYFDIVNVDIFSHAIGQRLIFLALTQNYKQHNMKGESIFSQAASAVRVAVV
jgi:hypothetical protein